MATAIEQEIPAHVPKELVRPWQLAMNPDPDRDPFDEIIPEIHAGPELFYAPNGSSHSVGVWIWRKARDIEAGFLNHEHFRSSQSARISALMGESWDLIPVELDQPDHTWYRALLNPFFSPKNMAALEADVRNLAIQLVDRMAEKSSADFMHDFATPFPVMIFLRLLGLPLDDMPKYLEWEHGLVHSASIESKARSMRAICDCLRAELAERRKRPREDVLTSLVTTELRNRRLTDDECLHTAFTLFTAGLDTVTSSLGWHFKHLATHGEDQQRLRENPDKVMMAAEELMRAYPPVTVVRVCGKDYHAGNGITIKAGDRLLLSTPLAARDPDAYENPNIVDFDRQPTHLTFAYGVHRCMGSHLARRELQTAIREAVTRLPPFRRATEGRLPMYFGAVLGLKSLPVTWA